MGLIAEVLMQQNPKPLNLLQQRIRPLAGKIVKIAGT